MNVHITVNLPNREFEVSYSHVKSLDDLLAVIKDAYPETASVVLVVTL